MIILIYVFYGVKSGPLLFPFPSQFLSAVNFPLKKSALVLKNPTTKMAHVIGRHNKTGKPKDWTCSVFGVLAAYKRAIMSEFVKIGKVHTGEG